MNKDIKYFLTNWKQICAPSQPLSHGLPDLPLFCLRGNRVLSPWISSFNSFHLMNNGRQLPNLQSQSLPAVWYNPLREQILLQICYTKLTPKKIYSRFIFWC